MDDTPHTGTTASPTPDGRKKTGRGVLWGLLAVMIAFSAGFLWQFFEATTARQQLADTESELVVERLRVRLGQAALAAQSGRYESARQQMSTFFGELRQQEGLINPRIEIVAEDFLAMRDEVITGLSRSNPEYADVLSGMLDRFSTAIDQARGATDSTDAGASDTGSEGGPGGSTPEGPAGMDTGNGAVDGGPGPRTPPAEVSARSR